MFHIDVRQRRDLISGLRALAAFLEVHPGLPLPLTADVTVYPIGTDEAMYAEIDRIAAMIGPRAEWSESRRGFYRVGIRFGPVLYRAVAIPEVVRARYEVAPTPLRSATEEDGRA